MTEKSNDKIAKIEEELKKMTNSHMALLIKYEESQKTSAEIIREKEKTSFLQKAKLNKLIKQFEETIKDMKQDKTKYLKKIEEL